MWNMAQMDPATICRPKPHQVAVDPSNAINRKTNSPAYMLPNSRMPSETVLATNSIRFKPKLASHSAGC